MPAPSFLALKLLISRSKLGARYACFRLPVPNDECLPVCLKPRSSEIYYMNRMSKDYSASCLELDALSRPVSAYPFIVKSWITQIRYSSVVVEC